MISHSPVLLHPRDFEIDRWQVFADVAAASMQRTRPRHATHASQCVRLWCDCADLLRHRHPFQGQGFAHVAYTGPKTPPADYDTCSSKTSYDSTTTHHRPVTAKWHAAHVMLTCFYLLDRVHIEERSLAPNGDLY